MDNWKLLGIPKGWEFKTDILEIPGRQVNHRTNGRERS